MNLNKTLSYVKEKGRLLDYYLILNLSSDKSYDDEILRELATYQNDNLGFGHGLEPDVQTPSSSVLACNIAIKVLEEVKSSKKEAFIKGLVTYLISQFNHESKSFNFLPSDKDDYPRAIWWNGDVNSNFGYFNPTPEVVGFLFKNRAYVEGFDIESLVDALIEKIKTDYSKEDKPHALYSVIKFYDCLDENRQKQLQEVVFNKIKEIISTSREEWKNYGPQPYKIITGKNHPLYNSYEEVIKDNIDFLLSSLDDNCVWMPEWSWGQYDDLYEETIRYKWMGFLCFERLKALKELR